MRRQGIAKRRSVFFTSHSRGDAITCIYRRACLKASFERVGEASRTFYPTKSSRCLPGRRQGTTRRGLDRVANDTKLCRRDGPLTDSRSAKSLALRTPRMACEALAERLPPAFRAFFGLFFAG